MDDSKAMKLCIEHGREHVAIGAGVKCQDDFVVMGHWLYVRECRPPDIKGQDGKVLLFRPERSKSLCTVCEILGIGKNVGRHRRPSMARARRTIPDSRRFNVKYKIGQKILRPTDHPWGMVVSGFAPKDELFIDENVPLLILED